MFFILDEMRNKYIENEKTTTWEGLEWGVLFGFGPGLTVEMVVLQCPSTHYRSLIEFKPSVAGF